MQIYLPELSQKQGKAVDFRFEEDLLSSFSEFLDGGTFKLVMSASLNDDQLVVNGSLEVSTTATCSRCLESFNQCFTTDFTELFTVLKNAPVESNRQIEALETANTLNVSGDYLYLDEYIRQLIILGQEYNPICALDCRGLCAGCGEDLNKSTCRCCSEKENIDLRFIKLKELNQE
ncbi:MAG: DUF177 domain-containing protein [Firmicutes bacterium]|nr:DUF177 domain-containing protein [Bacillota bacterium]